MSDDREDRRYEKIGSVILTASYWIYNVKFVLIVSVISLIPLFFLGWPLWLAPIIGIAVRIIYRVVRLAVFKFFIHLSE